VVVLQEEQVLPGGSRLNEIVVDRVQEVLDIAGEQIEEAPQFGPSVNTDFILGMGKVEQTVKILLDISKVLSSEALRSITRDCETAAAAKSGVDGKGKRSNERD
jgi:purine-binding chemotaxis protein CheW